LKQRTLLSKSESDRIGLIAQWHTLH